MDRFLAFLREFFGKAAGVLKSRKFWAAIGASIVLATSGVELAALVDGLSALLRSKMVLVTVKIIHPPNCKCPSTLHCSPPLGYLRVQR
jgi:hypothetical protein